MASTSNAQQNARLDGQDVVSGLIRLFARIERRRRERGTLDDWGRGEASPKQLKARVFPAFATVRQIYIQTCLSWRVKPATPWLRYRRQVFKRDGYTCAYCGTSDETILTIDHIIPRAQGGSDKPDNLVTACWSCNRRTWARTPEQANMVLRRDGTL